MKGPFLFNPFPIVKFREKSVGLNFGVHKGQIKPVGQHQRLIINFRASADEYFTFTA